MRKPSPYRTAAKIAWRETRASSGRFIFVILAVAAGVGSLTGVRGFSRAFHTMLQRDARTFMAADLTVRTFQLPTGQQTAEMDALAKRGIAHTQVTETLTMASPPNDAAPLLISVKAVDPAVYPFYGTVKFNPPMDRAHRAAARYRRGVRWRTAAPERACRRHDSHRRAAVSHQRRGRQTSPIG